MGSGSGFSCHRRCHSYRRRCHSCRRRLRAARRRRTLPDQRQRLPDQRGGCRQQAGSAGHNKPARRVSASAGARRQRLLLRARSYMKPPSYPGRLLPRTRMPATSAQRAGPRSRRHLRGPSDHPRFGQSTGISRGWNCGKASQRAVCESIDPKLCPSTFHGGAALPWAGPRRNGLPSPTPRALRQLTGPEAQYNCTVCTGRDGLG